ncbi:MAG: ankyrin repeat domain-containing protein [Candidatus Dependentiae bacterium]|nr:ankyrin repeat domain-containing protein [Candidatus Dependentiae bacterium]
MQTRISTCKAIVFSALCAYALQTSTLEAGMLEAVLEWLGLGESFSNTSWSLDLLVAVKNRDVRRVAELLSVGVKPNQLGVQLIYFVSTGFDENLKEERLAIAKLLIKNGAPVNGLGPVGISPLHAAALYGFPQMIELLAESGGELDAQEKMKRTPLHYAVEFPDFETTKLLVEYGSNLAIRNARNKTPLEIASNGEIKPYLTLARDLLQVMEKAQDFEKFAREYLDLSDQKMADQNFRHILAILAPHIKSAGRDFLKKLRGWMQEHKLLKFSDKNFDQGKFLLDLASHSKKNGRRTIFPLLLAYLKVPKTTAKAFFDVVNLNQNDYTYLFVKTLRSSNLISLAKLEELDGEEFKKNFLGTLVMGFKRVGCKQNIRWDTTAPDGLRWYLQLLAHALSARHTIFFKRLMKIEDLAEKCTAIVLSKAQLLTSEEKNDEALVKDMEQLRAVWKELGKDVKEQIEGYITARERFKEGVVIGEKKLALPTEVTSHILKYLDPAEWKTLGAALKPPA